MHSLLASCVIVIFTITYNHPLTTRKMTSTKSLSCFTRNFENKCNLSVNSNSTINIPIYIRTQMTDNTTQSDRKRINTITANVSRFVKITVASLQGLNFSTTVNRTIHKTTEKAKAVTAVNERITNTSTKMAYYKGQHIIADFQDFYNVTSDFLQDPLLNKHKFQLTLNNKQKCKGKDVFLCLFIFSATYDIRGRNMIRSTVGSVKDLEINTSNMHLFLVKLRIRQ